MTPFLVDARGAFLALAGPWIGAPAAGLLLSFVLAGAVAGVVSAYTAVVVYVERKVASFIQCRLGPMEVGPGFEISVAGVRLLPAGWYGLGVIIADSVKLLGKEDIVPADADRPLFRLAPYVVFSAALTAFAVIPAAPFLVPSGVDGGVLFLLAASSVGVSGLVMGGYASNNKWALYGAIRSVAQVISYAVPMGLAILAVVLTAGSLDLTAITRAQSGWFWNWFAFRNVWLLVAFVAYFIASLAETNRTPFDLPEAESELVAGYHVEYTGMRFAIFFLSEYTNMFLVSLAASVFFLGGYHTGIAPLDRFVLLSPPALLVKACLLVFLMIWLRWTLPRFRVDRLMVLCWKGLLPVTLVAFLGACVAALQEGLLAEIVHRGPILILVAAFIHGVRRGLRPEPALPVGATGAAGATRSAR